jgi:hypothetical protein
MRCWQCGVEPAGLVEITQMGEVEPRHLPTGWPRGDHPHAFDPPSPGELAEMGDRARRRIETIAAE